MTKPLVFISYSHQDEAEKTNLVTHLDVLKKAGLIELWLNDRIEGGADWEAEIKQAIVRANVAVLLISANFLTSDFILGAEVAAFLQRRESEGLTVFPVIAKACAWEACDWLAKMNVRPKNGRPIWNGPNSQIDEDLSKITREIKAIVKKADHAPALPKTPVDYPRQTKIGQISKPPDLEIETPHGTMRPGSPFYVELTATFFLEQQSLNLTLNEFHLLYHLYQHAGEICNRESCYQAIWREEYDHERDKGTLDGVVYNLRRKLKTVDLTAAKMIETRRRQGYVLNL